MSTHALRTAAARTAVIRSGSEAKTLSGRRPQLSTADQLERLSARLDELIRDVRLGATSHRQHERNVDEGEAIADGIRAVFRAATPAALHNPPLWQQGGRAIW